MNDNEFPLLDFGLARILRNALFVVPDKYALQPIMTLKIDDNLAVLFKSDRGTYYSTMFDKNYNAIVYIPLPRVQLNGAIALFLSDVVPRQEEPIT